MTTSINEPNAATYEAIEAAETNTDIFGPFDSVTAMMEALKELKE